MPVSHVQIRNTSRTTVVLTPNPDSKAYLRWEAEGDPDGGDVLFVERAKAEGPACINAVRSGTLQPVDLDPNDTLTKVYQLPPARARARAKRIKENPGLQALKITFNEEGKPVASALKVRIEPLQMSDL